MLVPWGWRWSGGDYTNDTCAVVDSSTPTPTPDPCRVEIDSSIRRTVNPPADCPDDENAAQQLAVFGISCLLAAL
ncbi:hypothetical protein EYZ11_012796 [Aspergillus tanneri]|uniref:DUF7136 domain-containing protein n=1 Tax=Aspergillus tanneri TaxID=1220188 RepID=A0A4S3J4Q2_9EURO|nr:hypothetical protein EYZ11_012796 [Aspergillus tanneri]